MYMSLDGSHAFARSYVVCVFVSETFILAGLGKACEMLVVCAKNPIRFTSGSLAVLQSYYIQRALQ